MMMIFYMIFMTLILLFKNMNKLNITQLMFILLMILFLPYNSYNLMSNLSYFKGNDFISYGLILMSFFIISLMILSMNPYSLKFINMFLLMNLILCICLYLIFSSINLLIMYMFFEFSLIPLLIMIFGWGYSPERLISGLYLFFYTLTASLPLLIFFLYLYINNGSLFWNLYLNVSNSFILNLFSLLAFLVKFPMFMVHFWLPKAHVQAPVFGSMILAGLLLKIGGYGMIRLMFINDLIFCNYSFIWYSLSIVGCILVSLICLIQGDVKSMIAYSSVAHMSMCIMGVMTMTKLGLFGMYMLMLSHGLCSSGMFCLISVSYERCSSRSFYINKGLMNLMPSMSMYWFLFCTFNMSCPPSLNFISEVFIFCSMFNYWSVSMIMFILISFFSACFSYYLFSYTQHGISHYMYCYSSGYSREYLLLIMHLIPITILILSMNFFYY